MNNTELLTASLKNVMLTSSMLSNIAYNVKHNHPQEESINNALSQYSKSCDTAHAAIKVAELSDAVASLEMTAYEMCIANIARAIRGSNPGTEDCNTAFQYALGIAKGFCKDPAEVVLDIVHFQER